jgi:WD40 repeat protein
MSLCFVGDTAVLASASYNNIVGLWHAMEGTRICEFTGSHVRCNMSASLQLVHSRATHLALCLGHIHNVNSVTASPDGAAVVSGSSDETFRVWEVADSRLGFLSFVCAFILTSVHVIACSIA